MFSDKRGTIAALTLGLLVGTGTTIGIVAASSDDNTPPTIPTAKPTDTPMNYTGQPLLGRGRGLDRATAVKRVTDAPGLNHVSIEQTKPDTLSVHVKTDTLEGTGDVRATWQAELAIGAVGELERTDQKALSDILTESTITADLPGSNVDLGNGHGFVAAGQNFAAQAANRSDRSIIQTLQAAAKKFDLSVVSTEILRPLGPAPSIVLQLNADTEKLDWNIDDLRTAFAGDPIQYEGLYVELRSTDGTPLIATGMAYRTGIGGTWFAPGQDERFGANHGTVAQAK